MSEWGQEWNAQTMKQSRPKINKIRKRYKQVTTTIRRSMTWEGSMSQTQSDIHEQEHTRG